MNASELLVKCLENEGVEYIFGLPGEETLYFTQALSESKKIKFITVRHEQGAAFMADVYGRLTGKAGVCLGTLGPGATNLVTGIADAQLDAAPVVAITGQGSLSRGHKESHQFIDIVKMFEPITKWNTSIVSPNSIPEIVRKAFKIAQSERPGATHIELPEDVSEAEAFSEPLPVTKTYYSHPQETDLRTAVELISKAKTPIVLIGNGVIRNKASQQLRKFIEINQLPVVNTYMSKGVVPNDYELNLFTIGMLHSKDYALCAVAESDLIIAIGYDLVESPPEKFNATCGKKILHMNTLSAEVDNCYLPELEIIADIKETLERLSTVRITQNDTTYAKTMKEVLKEKLHQKCKDPNFPIKPQRIISDLRTCTSDSDIVLSDVGSHKLWVARQYFTNEPNTVLISNGLASMGFALPGAIAAKLACPDKKVIVVCGDGGFLMNVQELETAKRLGLSFVVIIFDDGMYGAITTRQQKKWNNQFGSTFTNPDFVKLAESFGCHGYKITKTEELKPTIEKALNSEGIHIIDVPVDYSENLTLAEELSVNVCPIR
ncbi:MAG: acetolactate synthase large subunit [Candidatus Diapherotrites archaeon]|nr:acetolactate synthase large subunit [Candidatus Diapherotrites archaeon]